MGVWGWKHLKTFSIMLKVEREVSTIFYNQCLSIVKILIQGLNYTISTEKNTVFFIILTGHFMGNPALRLFEPLGEEDPNALCLCIITLYD